MCLADIGRRFAITICGQESGVPHCSTGCALHRQMIFHYRPRACAFVFLGPQTQPSSYMWEGSARTTSDGLSGPFHARSIRLAISLTSVVAVVACCDHYTPKAVHAFTGQISTVRPLHGVVPTYLSPNLPRTQSGLDRKSTRLNSSHA